MKTSKNSEDLAALGHGLTLCALLGLIIGPPILAGISAVFAIVAYIASYIADWITK